MKDIKTYSREVTKRVQVNNFGKLGYRQFKEYFVGDNEDLKKHNYRKHIKFNEDKTVCVFKDMVKGRIYDEPINR